MAVFRTRSAGPSLLLSLLFAIFVQTIAAKPCQKRSLPCSISSFQGVVNLPGVTVTVTKADHVANNGSYGDPTDLGYPQPIDKLPELCAVTVQITNTSDQPGMPISSYKLGMFLPVKWNVRFLAVGGGSFAGGINWQGMSEGPHYGFATVSTDTGHNSVAFDQSWANPQTLYDWGYRAMHGSIVVGKLLVKHYYGQDFPYSYYAGCSTGGRQGLREIQYDASSFDGAMIGSAAWDTVGLMPWISKIAYDELIGPATDQLSQTQMSIIAAEVLRQCDGVDGHADGIVSEPNSCKFDISKIVCADPTRCINQGQAKHALDIYADYVVDGRLVAHGFGLTSEDQWSVYFPDTATMQTGDFNWERYMIYNNTAYTYLNFSDRVVADGRRVNPGSATADHFDIRPYRDGGGTKGKGGKILMYHGLADGLISPKTSTQYYEATAAAVGTDVAALKSWFRYFQVPGMQHCFFSTRYNAPWDFAAFAQAAELRLLPQFGLPAAGDGWSVPGHLGDPAYDAYAALMEWVEKDRPIDQIIATAFNSDMSVNRTRPLCPYPQKAIYGSGDINDAKSWHCG